MSSSDRSKIPAGTGRGPPPADPHAADRTADLDDPTDQGPADPGPSISEPHVGQLLEEPELPKRDSGRAVIQARKVAPDPESGEVIGDYDLLVKLGRGGAGSVFQARRRSDGAIVALKVLAASKVSRARIVQRFFDEVRASSAVMHPGLIRVLDFIEEEEPRRLAYAMEYVEGETLRERIKHEGALDLREAISIGIEVCDALGALHDAGIIHRDLKPENIMVLKHEPAASPKVKLLDYGVVKFLPIDKSGGASQPASPNERPGTFVGTPRYMAPEQAAGGAVDTRADLFSVGVLLFEMITGTCPHIGDSLRDVVLAKLKGAPRIRVNPGKEILPQELTDIVDACLQLKPALRPKDAAQVMRALREAVVVLFAVGPVKADEDGLWFRPGAQTTTDTATANRPPAVAVHHAREVSSPRGMVGPPPPRPSGPSERAAGAVVAVETGAKAEAAKAAARGAHHPRRLVLVLVLLLAAGSVIVALAIRGSSDEVLLVPLEAQKGATATATTTAAAAASARTSTARVE